MVREGRTPHLAYMEMLKKLCIWERTGHTCKELPRSWTIIWWAHKRVQENISSNHHSNHQKGLTWRCWVHGMGMWVDQWFQAYRRKLLMKQKDDINHYLDHSINYRFKNRCRLEANKMSMLKLEFRDILMFVKERTECFGTTMWTNQLCMEFI